MPKANPYDPKYIMKRDGVSHKEALNIIADMKRRNGHARGKKFSNRNSPYDPKYVMKRDNISYEEACVKIEQYKAQKATSLANFERRYGKDEGKKRYQEWKEKSLAKGHAVARENGSSQSKFSPSYYVRHGYSQEEAYALALEFLKENSPLHVEYYIKRGHSLSFARNKIRKIHDKKLGRDSYREFLEKTTNMSSEEIEQKIKEIRGNCSREALGNDAFEDRIAKIRKTMERKGIWVPVDDLSDYEQYRRQVWQYTNQNDLSVLPNFEKRALAGTENGYHLDHKYSISQGYINQVTPELIGSIKNLEFIPWQENVKKQGKCTITEEELVNED